MNESSQAQSSSEWPPVPVRAYWEVLLFVILCSLFLAGARMGHSVWFDESLSVRIAAQPTIAEVAQASIREKPYPPLFFVPVHYSLLFASNEFGLRVPAALFGGLAMVGIFLLGWQVSGKLTGLAAAALFWLTPGAFRYFVDGNAYTLLMALAALSTWMLLRALKEQSWHLWLLYALFAALMLMTHTLAVFTAAAQCAAAIWWLRLQPARERTPLLRVGLAFGLLLAVWIPWAWIYLSQGVDVRPIRLGALLDWRTLAAAAGMYLGPQSYGDLAQLGIWLVLQISGVIALFRRDRRVFMLLAIIAGGTVIGTTFFIKSTLNYVAYRYGIAAFPVACVIAVQAFPALGGLRPVRVFYGTLLLVYFVLGAHFYLRGGEKVFEFQDWRSAAAYVGERSIPGDQLVFLAHSDVPPFRYYRDPTQPQSVAETSEKLQAVFASLKISGKRAWVLSGDFHNENPWVRGISMYLERPYNHRMAAAIQELRAMEGNVCEQAEFLRVRVAVVQFGGCEMAAAPETARARAAEPTPR